VVSHQVVGADAISNPSRLLRSEASKAYRYTGRSASCHLVDVLIDGLLGRGGGVVRRERTGGRGVGGKGGQEGGVVQRTA